MMTTSPLKVTRILKIKGSPERKHWFDLFWGIIFHFQPFCSENRTAPTLGEASVQPGPWFRRWNAFRWGSWTSLLGGSVLLENQQASWSSCITDYCIQNQLSTNRKQEKMKVCWRSTWAVVDELVVFTIDWIILAILNDHYHLPGFQGCKAFFKIQLSSFWQ